MAANQSEEDAAQMWRRTDVTPADRVFPGDPHRPHSSWILGEVVHEDMNSFLGKCLLISVSSILHYIGWIHTAK